MAQFSNKDFDAIEAAVLNTARGRWFLAEHARRNRAADTLTLLEAIRKLENLMTSQAGQAASAAPPALLAELDDIGQAVSAAKEGISAACEEMPPPSGLNHRLGTVTTLLAHVEERLTTLLGRAEEPDEASNPLTADNLKYFSADEELFTAPGAPADLEAGSPSPLAGEGREGDGSRSDASPPPRMREGSRESPSEPPAAASTEPQTRVVIVRSGLSEPGTSEATAEAEAPAPAEPVVPTKEEPILGIEALPPEPAAPPEPEPAPTEDRKRIVVIRGKPSGETRIPLAEESNGQEEPGSQSANPAA